MEAYLKDEDRIAPPYSLPGNTLSFLIGPNDTQNRLSCESAGEFSIVVRTLLTFISRARMGYQIGNSVRLGR